MERVLPLGSIITTKNDQNLMIIGYLPSKPNDEEFYDYVCCRNRLGVRKQLNELEINKDIFYLKSRDIKQLKYIGYSDYEFEHYADILVDMKEKIIDARQDEKEVSKETLTKIYQDFLDNLKGMRSEKNEE